VPRETRAKLRPGWDPWAIAAPPPHQLRSPARFFFCFVFGLVNCETYFVARNPEYAELVNTVAMQIAASDVLYVDAADADPERVAKEREIEMGKEDLLSKPENIRGNINKGPPMKTSR